MILYRVFGLTFQSDCELPGLEPIQQAETLDYCIKFKTDKAGIEGLRREFGASWYVSPRRLKCGVAAVEVWKTGDSRRFRFRFYDGVEFIIDRAQQVIWVDGLRKLPLCAAIHHLLFSLPGFLLSLRKSICLHGAAIGRRDRAIALIGASNSGKSLLSAEMASQGNEILTDDLVAVDVIHGISWAHPGYPWICLRPASLPLLSVDRSDMECMRPEWKYLDESYITWDLPRAAPGTLPKARKLEVIFLLNPLSGLKGKPRIQPVPRHQALMELMDAANRTHIPFPEFRIQEFSLLASVVDSVPVHRLLYRPSPRTLTHLVNLLSKESRQFGTRLEEAQS
jgi:hypothetical protein